MPCSRKSPAGPLLGLAMTCALPAQSDAAATRDEDVAAAVRQHCVRCHGTRVKKGGLDLDAVRALEVARHPDVWENVVRKLEAGQMPPPDKRRPPQSVLDALRGRVADALDAAAAARPRPGRTETFRRLTRFEYGNAVRDLLALQVDTDELLPADEASHGFDNVTVGDLPPALLTRYVAAARRISRLATGGGPDRPDGHTWRVPPDVTQEKHAAGLPLGTRGGLLVRHTFPKTGVYEISARLTRDRNEQVEGLQGAHTLEFLLDRARVADFVVAKPKEQVANHFDDTQLRSRFRVTAGPHDLGVTFVANDASLLETGRQPLEVHFNFHRHPRLTPAVYQVTVTGPFPDRSPGEGEADAAPRTPSRQRIFGEERGKDAAAARRILGGLARRAWRGPPDPVDLDRLLEVHRAADGFEAGIEAGLAAILVSPRFLFRIEREPEGIAPGTPYRVSDLELASRLSFFLWSSSPDDTLLEAAERGALRDPAGRARQVRRMLRDPRAAALAENFAGQWLHLRNLASRTPDNRRFPDFDHNLRQSMRRETELLFAEVVREDRSVFDLIRADHTWLDERLARHYGIPHVLGSRFRRVDLHGESHRGGLLRHASILTVTSYATRTSPVVRGKWILENLLGVGVPPPPAEVPALDQGVIPEGLTVRERLQRHRADKTCASCHRLIDPVGFGLENFDAVGRWRALEAGRPVDATGAMPDGSEFDGVGGLEEGILARPHLFAGTLTRKLMTYALGRGVDHDDGPAVRGVVRAAAGEGFRFSAVVLGIVESPPFLLRTKR